MKMIKKIFTLNKMNKEQFIFMLNNLNEKYAIPSAKIINAIYISKLLNLPNDIFESSVQSISKSGAIQLLNAFSITNIPKKVFLKLEQDLKNNVIENE